MRNRIKNKKFKIATEINIPDPRNVQPNYKCKLNLPLFRIQLLKIANFTTIGNVERKLATHFQVSNWSSDIPAGVRDTQFIRKQIHHNLQFEVF